MLLLVLLLQLLLLRLQLLQLHRINIELLRNSFETQYLLARIVAKQGNPLQLHHNLLILFQL